MPPGSGVPVPGAKAGSSTSTSTLRNTGPAPTMPTRALDHRADADLAHVVHEQRVMPRSCCQANSRLARPVAAQADLDVARRVDVALLDEPVHDRPVRELDAEDLLRRCRCGCRSGSARPGPRRRAIARMSGSAIEWSPPRMIGSAPASTTWPTSASIAACVRTGVGRAARRRRRSRRPAAPPCASIARLQVRAGRAARRRGSRAGRSGCPGRSETRSSVGAPTIATSTPASSAASCV